MFAAIAMILIACDYSDSETNKEKRDSIIINLLMCGTATDGEGTPKLQFTPTQPIKVIGIKDISLWRNTSLGGWEKHVAPTDYRVVVYIHIGAFGWWIENPIATISCDGSWSVPYRTDNNDESIEVNTSPNHIAAFLIPAGYNPPQLRGADQLPLDLFINSKANIIVTDP